MKRIQVALAILAAATFAVTGCGGGGGGGGGGNPGVTTSLQGRVLDYMGSPVDGAQLSSSGGNKAPAITNSLGVYTLTGVPVGTSITITISKLGLTTKTLTGVVIDPTAGNAADMDVVMNNEAPPAGSSISIKPLSGATEVVFAEPRTFAIEVRNSSGMIIYPNRDSGWMATLIVTGAAYGAISESEPSQFQVSGTEANKQAKITVLMARADGTLAPASVTVTVKESDMPPPPPL